MIPVTREREAVVAEPRESVSTVGRWVIGLVVTTLLFLVTNIVASVHWGATLSARYESSEAQLQEIRRDFNEYKKSVDNRVDVLKERILTMPCN